ALRFAISEILSWNWGKDGTRGRQITPNAAAQARKAPVPIVFRLPENAEADQADDDEVGGDDVVEKPRHQQDENPSQKGDDGLQMGNTDDHGKSFCGAGGRNLKRMRSRRVPNRTAIHTSLMSCGRAISPLFLKARGGLPFSSA